MAISSSIQLYRGISCENCYAFMGAGIMIIVQYGYGGDYFDFEVKAGGGVGVSANVKLTNTGISYLTEMSLVVASTRWFTSSLGAVVKLNYKFGGLNAALSGSGSATGSLQFGTTQKASAAIGILYKRPSLYYAGEITPLFSYELGTVAPYSFSTSLRTTSLSVALALTAVQNFEISYSYIKIAFDASISGTVSHSLGSTGYAYVSVFSDAGRRALQANHSNIEQKSPLEAQHFNFLPGDVTVISFEYSEFNPSEKIILFYFIQRLDVEYPIMQKNFTTSESGSGIFEGSWTVPWDYILAGVGKNDTVISVRATNSISKTFNSESFGLSVFTESDGIFSS
jgi:hypothetical protein